MPHFENPHIAPQDLTEQHDILDAEEEDALATADDMAWVRTFCGCISTRKGVIVIATLALVSAQHHASTYEFPNLCMKALSILLHYIPTLSIPVLISIGRDFRRFSSHQPDYTGALRAYRKILITAIILIVLYAMSSLILIFAAQKNVRMMHVPWILVHPVITVGLVTLMCYVAALLGRNTAPVNQVNAVQIVFSIFVCLWIMTYLWVVVVSNYQKLSKPQDGDDAPLVEINAWPRQKGLRRDGKMKRRSWKQNSLVVPAPIGPQPPSPAVYDLAEALGL
ncbi:unnamed protein product [Darwinula stevensoni]|uniref:Uncharacterized protein n=1 Tax=Darwinula stevensoni TaxID=69355 RepID=A0A7R9A960_9CRUS|nr:unnamed protein product [Darwinula stevensoni]CAG0897098.1 unnamed protein product [Darwinula stevensoni]